ncbi:MAG TPA: hypothetical protein VME43_04730 [Bryobacteraceae bacterium]|nr:hypothetical protein [Bryobacteraceae bacterium]
MRNASLVSASRGYLALLGLLAPLSCFAQQAPGYTVTTVAGCIASSCNNKLGGPATSVYLYYTLGIALDSAGNLYFGAQSLSGGDVIAEVSPAGVISVVAGGGQDTQFLGDGGPATSGYIGSAHGVAVDGAGNLYIADYMYNRIRKVANGTITTIAGPGSGPLGDGGPASDATLSEPSGVAVDAAGNVYIADTEHNRVRKISLDGTISTVAGNGETTSNGGVLGDGGPAVSATVTSPTAVALDSQGNLYIADSAHLIRKVSPAGTITTVAGNGSSLYYGDGGPVSLAGLGELVDGLAVDSAGSIYLTQGNGLVRMVTPDGIINTIAGGGTLTEPALNNAPANSAAISAFGVVAGPGGTIYITSYQYTGQVLALSPSSTPVLPKPSVVTTIEASGFGGYQSLAPGAWVEIYGSYLAGQTRPWGGSDFNGSNAPTSLSGTSVMIGGQPAFVSYISPSQINAEISPAIGTGPQPLVITTANGISATYSVTVLSVEPGLLAPAAFKIDGISYAAAVFSDGTTYVLPTGAIAGVPSRPAQAGDTITFYGVGFGPTTPSIPAGQIVQASNTLISKLQVFFDDSSFPGTVTYAGLAPGYLGVYQFNVTVPKLPANNGHLPIYFELGSSLVGQSLYVAVQ